RLGAHLRWRRSPFARASDNREGGIHVENRIHRGGLRAAAPPGLGRHALQDRHRRSARDLLCHRQRPRQDGGAAGGRRARGRGDFGFRGERQAAAARAGREARDRPGRRLPAFVERGASRNPEAARIIRPLRVILPLYNTEIHYIVRADSELNYLHDIKDSKINGGLVGSGAAFITHTLYRMMFDGPMPEAAATYLPNDQALIKLITDKSVDVAVVAAGQPAPI